MNVINGLNTHRLMDKHAINHYTVYEKQLSHADEHIFMHVYGRNIILTCTECTVILLSQVHSRGREPLINTHTKYITSFGFHFMQVKAIVLALKSTWYQIVQIFLLILICDLGVTKS